MMTNRVLLGKGRVSAVYSDGSYAYKTFDENHPREWIEYEVRIQQEIKTKTSLPVLSYTLSDDHREIRMDLIKGVTLADRLRTGEYQNGFHDMMELQMAFYAYRRLDLPDAQDAYDKQICHSSLAQPLKDKAIASLHSVERKDILCHFDFHPENIMVDGNQYYILDCVNAKLAHPAFDLARTYIILKQYVSRQADKYLREIVKKLQMDIQEVFKAIPAMAAIRLIEMETSDFTKTLIDMIMKDWKG
ncbi:MAG: phosphotransferase [Candidatus Izemoplasmatales bacterium]|mgnify:CR=1 FL=1|nr:phosphotransferase [Candidatus Izemoplasmatales bacterium]MDY0373107.1 phosphotransferase [Candidatus Izemoplasmatales bacterium]